MLFRFDFGDVILRYIRLFRIMIAKYKFVLYFQLDISLTAQLPSFIEAPAHALEEIAREKHADSLRAEAKQVNAVCKFGVPVVSV